MIKGGSGSEAYGFGGRIRRNEVGRNDEMGSEDAAICSHEKWFGVEGSVETQ